MLSWGDSSGYQLISRIGSGTFGQVYRVRRNGIDYAMKKFFVESSDEHPLSNALSETSIIRTWSFPRETDQQSKQVKQSEHPYLITLHDVCLDGRRIALILPLGNENLEEWINRQHIGNPNYKQMNKFAVQICRGIATLHNLGIIHSDIKPSNVVIRNGNAKLCDFGNSYSLFADEVLCPGTTWYMAPEVYEDGDLNQSYPADIWSLGCLLYAMYVGNILIKPQTYLEYPYCLARAIPKCTTKILSWMGISEDHHNRLMYLNRNVTSRFTRISDLDALLEQIFQWYPSKRPNIFEILQQAMFKDVLEEPFEISRKSPREILDDHYDDSWRYVNKYLSPENRAWLLDWESGVLLNTPLSFSYFLTVLGRQMAKRLSESRESLNDRMTIFAILQIAFELNFETLELPIESDKWTDVYDAEQQICRDQDMSFHFSTPVRYCSLVAKDYDYRVINKAKRYVVIGMLSGLAYDQPMLLAEAAIMLVGKRYGISPIFTQTEAHNQLCHQLDELVTPELNSPVKLG
jgi:serine/threonine protein kinase